MTSAMELSQGWSAAMATAIAVECVAPLVLAWVVHRRLHVGWRFFGYGMLIFFLFQLVTRVPLVQVAQGLLLGALQASPPLTWAWLAVLALTAGLFEEVGRWAGYRWLFKPEQRTWDAGVMYGLGHGGLESIVLVGGLSAVTLVGLLRMSGVDLAQLPPEQRTVVQAQLGALAAQPAWLPLLGAWERLSALAMHVGLSVVVLQVFRRGSLRWLALAIAGHAAFDFVAVGVARLLGPGEPYTPIVAEVVITAMGVIALAVAWQLRDRADQPECAVAGAGPMD